MKKKLFLFAAVILFATTGFSQKFNHVIKTSPITLAFGNLNVKYEKPINSKASVQIGVFYLYKLFGVEINGYGGEAGFRYYFTNAKKEIPSGFYAMPQAKYSTAGSGVDKIADFSIGAELGYQWAFDSGFALDLGVGPLYHMITVDDNYTGGSNQTDNFIFPTATFAIGYAF
ncbi:MAG: DUF3575 domain-containing protein [Bacteroidota bacterium]